MKPAEQENQESAKSGSPAALAPNLRATMLAAQDALLAKGEELERRIGDLYAACAGRFPEEQTFWLDLMKEEKEHVVLIQALRNALRHSGQLLDFNQSVREGLHTLDALMTATRKKLDAKRLTPVEMLRAALALEAALLDQSFFNLLKAKDPIFRSIARKLSVDTQHHYNQITATLRAHLASKPPPKL